MGPPVSDAEGGRCPPFLLPVAGAPGHHSVAVFRTTGGESARPTITRHRACPGGPTRRRGGVSPVGRRRSLPLRERPVGSPGSTGRRAVSGAVLPFGLPAFGLPIAVRSPCSAGPKESRRARRPRDTTAPARAARLAGEAAFLRSAGGRFVPERERVGSSVSIGWRAAPRAVFPIGLPVARSSGLHRSRCSEGPKESRRARRPRDAAPAGAPVVRRDSGRPPAVGSGARAASGFGGSIGLRAAAAAVLTFRLFPAVNGSLFGRGSGATTGRGDGRHSHRAGPRSAWSRRPRGKPRPSGSGCFPVHSRGRRGAGAVPATVGSGRPDC